MKCSVAVKTIKYVQCKKNKATKKSYKAQFDC